MLVWFERAVVQLVLCSALMVNHGVCEILNNDPLNKKEKKTTFMQMMMHYFLYSYFH